MNKKILIILALFLTATALVLAALERKNITNFIGNPPEESNGPTAAQIKADAEVNATAKKEHIENTVADTPPASQSPNIDLSAKQEANSTVTVFTKLFNVSNGTCKLTISNGSEQTTQTADVIYQREYSSCAGFSVPVSTLGSGTWEIALVVTSNGQTHSKNINFEVGS